MTEQNGFKYSILASGSTGNSFYLETPKKKILVDAGLSGKKIESLLSEIDRDIHDIDALLITHEHSDHIKGIGVLARKYGIDLYANEDTWSELDSKNALGKIPVEQKHLFEMGKTMTFGDIDIESFGVSHDAIAPQFYRFMKDNKSFVMLTDTGYVSDRMRGTIENADAYLMESNHDIEILRMGAYPWRTKQRILSDQGHLSNEDGAEAAFSIHGNKTKRIFLGHLSLNNNIKELAHLTMDGYLQQHDVDTKKDLKIHDIDALLITHEHSDHIKGIGVLARKYGIDLYANEDTWSELDSKNALGKIPVEQKHLFEMGKTMTFGDIDIESFGVSHDAIAPQFYRFMKDNKSFVMLTDTGYVSDRMRGTIENADAYLMESNHDIEILRMGAYPWRTKQRILSDQGHLSNEDGAEAAFSIHGNKTKRIFLGHLSLNNNIKELAHLTMDGYLQQHDVDTKKDLKILDTSHEHASQLYDI